MYAWLYIYLCNIFKGGCGGEKNDWGAPETSVSAFTFFRRKTAA